MTDSKWKERAVLLNLNSVNLDSVKLRFIKNDRFTDLVKQPFLVKHYICLAGLSPDIAPGLTSADTPPRRR